MGIYETSKYLGENMAYYSTLSRRIKQFIIEFNRKFAAMALHAE